MDFGKRWEKFWDVFIYNNGYTKVLEGLQNTLIIAVFGLMIGILIGTILATIEVAPGYHRTVKVFKKLCRFYIGLFRGTPVVVQLLMGHFVIMPLLGFNMPAVQECILVFGFNSGAYVSEIMRGGIQSVDSGQMEAGRAVGLSYTTTMRLIVIPQAIKNILPTLGNEFIALIKETSVVSFIGAADLYVAFSYIGTNAYEYMVPYTVMAAIYIVLVMIITYLIKIMERRLARSDRRH